MRRRLAIALCVGVLAATMVPVFPATDAAQQRELGPGDMAPDFSLPGSDGKTYKLSNYRGKQAVVLAWFAKAKSAG